MDAAAAVSVFFPLDSVCSLWALKHLFLGAGWDLVCWSTVWAARKSCWRISVRLTCPKKSTLLSTGSSPPSLSNRSVCGRLPPMQVWKWDVCVDFLLLQILNALTCEVLEHQGSFRTPSDQIQYIAQTLKDSTCVLVFISILFKWWFSFFK